VGSRTWIKIYYDRWLNGTIREESLEVRAVWIDLLVLAGSGKYGDSGEVKITDSIGFLDQQLADLLQISTRKWKIISKRLQETDRICISQNNVIAIKNWAKYQSEYERTKPYRIGDTVTKSTVESTRESTQESTARDRDKRLETRDYRLENKEETKQEESLVQFLPSEEIENIREIRAQKAKEVIDLYQEGILGGGTIPEDMEREVKSACNRYSTFWVSDAINESCAQNHPDWRYIVGILRNWSKYGKKAR